MTFPARINLSFYLLILLLFSTNSYSQPEPVGGDPPDPDDTFSNLLSQVQTSPCDCDLLLVSAPVGSSPVRLGL